MQAIAATVGSSDPLLIDTDAPPSPTNGEVLCKTLQVGVCGTDREILLSEQPWVPDGTDRIILGHECLARIEEIGAGVEDFQVGDLVVPAVRRATTDLDRRVDLLPFGSYVERGIVLEDGFASSYWFDRPEHLFKVDPAIESVAVFTEPMTVVEKGANEALAIQRGRLGESIWRGSPPRVLVTGMGPIGFAGILACRCRGWPVTMYGRDDADSFRAQTAVSLGAHYTSARDNDLAPQDVEADGYDLILECTGSDEIMMRASKSLASCGMMVWVGSSRDPRPTEHNVSRLMRDGLLRNHVHVGTVNAAPRDFIDALRHLEQLQQSYPAELQLLITDRVAPEESLWHYQHRRPQGIKTVLMYD